MDADHLFMDLIRAVVQDDAAAVTRLLADVPALARAHAGQGATRERAETFLLDEVGHYLYAGDTALHIAAAAHNPALVRTLVQAHADAGAGNRRGAQPLHYAADGQPGSGRWRPEAQAETVACLIAAGADPNATDKSGVAPLHRAVRTRCAAAAEALLDGGADPSLPNKSGSTPLKLATHTTGRGGSGTAEAKAQQELIIELLEARGAAQ